MKKNFLIVSSFFLLLILPARLAGGEMNFDQEKFEKGRYIVHSVSMCILCHTPRDEQGELIEERLLTGAAIPVESPYPGMRWAIKSANIAGLTAWTFEEAVQFLKTGLRPDGTYPDLPMPPFRMSQEDAEAVVMYLKNVKPLEG